MNTINHSFAGRFNENAFEKSYGDGASGNMYYSGYWNLEDGAKATWEIEEDRYPYKGESKASFFGFSVKVKFRDNSSISFTSDDSKYGSEFDNIRNLDSAFYHMRALVAREILEHLGNYAEYPPSTSSGNQKLNCDVIDLDGTDIVIGNVTYILKRKEILA